MKHIIGLPKVLKVCPFKYTMAEKIMNFIINLLLKQWGHSNITFAEEGERGVLKKWTKMNKGILILGLVQHIVFDLSCWVYKKKLFSLVLLPNFLFEVQPNFFERGFFELGNIIFEWHQLKIKKITLDFTEKLSLCLV